MTNSFKLIAIVPLKGCDQKFRKNLVTGVPYQFYQNYDIVISPDGESVESVNFKEVNEAEEELYNLGNDLGIQISAVVGKNGSGKSTLFDLLYQLIYIISTDKKLVSEAVITPYSQDLKIEFEHCKKTKWRITNWKVSESDTDYLELLKIVERFNLKINPRSFRDAHSFFQKVKGALNDKILKIYNDIEDEEKAEKELKTGLALSLIYEQNNEIFELSYAEGNLYHSSFKKGSKIKLNEDNAFKFQDLFYNLSLNYSHHSLNSLNVGNWVMKLFHKNDGYITPVVINPMRNEGSFNINTEIKLSRERIMINIVSFPRLELLVNPKLWFFRFKIDRLFFIPFLESRSVLNRAQRQRHGIF